MPKTLQPRSASPRARYRPMKPFPPVIQTIFIKSRSVALAQGATVEYKKPRSQTRTNMQSRCPKQMLKPALRPPGDALFVLERGCKHTTLRDRKAARLQQTSKRRNHIEIDMPVLCSGGN